MTPLTILGGGPAGLAVAYYAGRRRIPFVLFERSGELGGLSRTVQSGGHRYDTGAHRFHDRFPDVTSDVRSLLGADLRPVDAPSQIYERGRFIDFPPTPLNLLASAGVAEAGRMLYDLAIARVRRRSRTSFADFAIGQFGERLARRLLLDYSQKVWGLAGHELSTDIATRRLQGMTLRSLLVELLAPSRRTSHLDGGFFYPRLGFGQIVDALAAALPRDSVRARREVAGFDVTRRCVRAVRFSDGAVEPVAGRVLCTLPLPLTTALLGDHVPQSARRAASSLRFRHVRLVFLRLAQPRVTANASIYLPDPALCISRISESKNRSPEMAPAHETGLVAEVPCSDGDAIARLEDARLIERVVDELDGIGLVARGRILETDHHFLANAYPVYSLGYAAAVQEVLAGVGQIENLDTLGRAGRFFYSHLHDQMAFAKSYVEGIAGRTAVV